MFAAGRSYRNWRALFGAADLLPAHVAPGLGVPKVVVTHPGRRQRRREPHRRVLEHRVDPHAGLDRPRCCPRPALIGRLVHRRGRSGSGRERRLVGNPARRPEQVWPRGPRRTGHRGDVRGRRRGRPVPGRDALPDGLTTADGTPVTRRRANRLLDAGVLAEASARRAVAAYAPRPASVHTGCHTSAGRAAASARTIRSRLPELDLQYGSDASPTVDAARAGAARGQCADRARRLPGADARRAQEVGRSPSLRRRGHHRAGVERRVHAVLSCATAGRRVLGSTGGAAGGGSPGSRAMDSYAFARETA